MRPRRGVRSESAAVAVKAPLSRRTPKLRSPARRVDLSRTGLVQRSAGQNPVRRTCPVHCLNAPASWSAERERRCGGESAAVAAHSKTSFTSPAGGLEPNRVVPEERRAEPGAAYLPGALSECARVVECGARAPLWR